MNTKDYIIVDIEFYLETLHKATFYSKYKYNNGMISATSALHAGRIDHLAALDKIDENGISGQSLEERNLIKMNKYTLQDVMDCVEWCVNNKSLNYNKVADNQWLRAAKRLMQ